MRGVSWVMVAVLGALGVGLAYLLTRKPLQTGTAGAAVAGGVRPAGQPTDPLAQQLNAGAGILAQLGNLADIWGGSSGADSATPDPAALPTF